MCRVRKRMQLNILKKTGQLFHCKLAVEGIRVISVTLIYAFYSIDERRASWSDLRNISLCTGDLCTN